MGGTQDTGRMNKKIDPVLVLAGYVVAVHVPVTVLTWRDLRGRSAERVRGRKWVWRVASCANTVGSVVYWLVGRR
jgi:hypothetical protein